jgi:hypothetical protein
MTNNEKSNELELNFAFGVDPEDLLNSEISQNSYSASKIKKLYTAYNLKDFSIVSNFQDNYTENTSKIT